MVKLDLVYKKLFSFYFIEISTPASLISTPLLLFDFTQCSTPPPFPLGY